MAKVETYYPKEEFLGKECFYWGNRNGCQFPRAEMKGRRSCEGIIDPVCIYLRTGKFVMGLDLTNEQIVKLKTTPPGDPLSIPAGKPTIL